MAFPFSFFYLFDRMKPEQSHSSVRSCLSFTRMCPGLQGCAKAAKRERGAHGKALKWMSMNFQKEKRDVKEM